MILLGAATAFRGAGPAAGSGGSLLVLADIASWVFRSGCALAASQFQVPRLVESLHTEEATSILNKGIPPAAPSEESYNHAAVGLQMKEGFFQTVLSSLTN